MIGSEVPSPMFTHLEKFYSLIALSHIILDILTYLEDAFVHFETS